MQENFARITKISLAKRNYTEIAKMRIFAMHGEFR